MFVLVIQGLEFYGFHGVPSAEREIGHRYLVDLKATVIGKASETDHIQDSVDYCSLCKIVLDVSNGRQFKTIEAFAESIVDTCLESHTSVLEVDLTLKKVAPPAPYILASVGVRIVRKRGA